MHARYLNLNILLFSAFLGRFSGSVSAESEVLDLVTVAFSYNRDMLPYWQAIATSTQRFLWSFVVQPQAKP